MLSDVLTVLALIVGLPGAVLSILHLIERHKRKRYKSNKKQVVEQQKLQQASTCLQKQTEREVTSSQASVKKQEHSE